MKIFNKKHLSLTLVIAMLTMITGTLQAQVIYEVGKMSMSLVDSARNYRNVPMSVFYPADVKGNNVPVAAPSNKKFPMIVFAHAKFIHPHHYSYLVDYYVPRGFMMAFPKTENGNNYDAEDMAMDMVLILDAFEKMHANPSSHFYGKYNGRSCASGHGMGGGAAYLAADMKQDINVLFTVGAAETSPSAIAVAPNLTLPALVFAGGKDCVVPTSGNQEPLFNSLGSQCKVYVNQLEATHCQFAMDIKKCNKKKEKNCPVSATPVDTINFHTNRLSVSFLRYYLKYNVLAWPLFVQKLTTFPDLVYVNQCIVPGSPRVMNTETEVVNIQPDSYRLGENTLEENTAKNIYRINLYPNPASLGGNTSLELSAFKASEVTITIFNTMGQYAYNATVNLNEEDNYFTLPTSDLKPGNYIVMVTDKKNRITRPLLIQ